MYCKAMVVAICMVACGPQGVTIVDDTGQEKGAATVEAELADQVGGAASIVPAIGDLDVPATMYDREGALDRQHAALPHDVRAVVEEALRRERDPARSLDMACGDDVSPDLSGATYVEAEDGDGTPTRCAAWLGSSYRAVERLVGRRP